MATDYQQNIGVTWCDDLESVEVSVVP